MPRQEVGQQAAENPQAVDSAVENPPAEASAPGETAAESPPRKRGRPRKEDQAARAEETAKLVCASGHPCPELSRFCPECGQSVAAQQPPSEWRDRNGHLNPPEHNFCMVCGAPRSEPSQSLAGAFAASPQDLRPGPPKPWNQLTPEEKAQRQAEHAAAVAAGQRDPQLSYGPAPQGQTYTIHFIKDGLSFAGVVWLRGQEISLEVGSPRWKEAESWIQLDDFDQVERFGDVYFRKGPWRGKSYRDAAREGWTRLKDKDGNEIPPPSEEQLAAADEAERRRARRVPQPAL